MSKAAWEKGTIEVYDPDTGEVTWKGEALTESCWKMLAQAWEETATLIRIPKWAVGWKRAIHLTPNMCVFTATKDYCTHMLGRKLDTSDEDFFKLHPLAHPQGIGAVETPRVVQDLIEPYGLRVSRIFWEPGIAPPGDLVNWMATLGTNPLAMTDYTTTNEEFAKQVGMDPAEAAKLFRFEFSQADLRPCISCGLASATTVIKGQASTTKFGHASYRGPRYKGTPGMMQLQIGFAQDVSWALPLEELKLDPKDIPWELDPYMCRGKDNKLLPLVSKSYSFPPTRGGSSYNMGTGGGFVDGQGTLQFPKGALKRGPETPAEVYTYASLGPVNACLLHHEAADSPINTKDMTIDGICDMCWTKTWSIYRCWQCGENLATCIYVGVEKYPDERWFVCSACNDCGKINHLSSQESTFAAKMVGIVLGRYKGRKGGDKTDSNSGSQGGQSQGQGGAASVLPRTHRRPTAGAS